MLDFYRIFTKAKQITPGRPGPETRYATTIYPEWDVSKREDLMTRGGRFYAVWDPRIELWSTDINVVVQLVDTDLRNAASQLEAKGEKDISVLSLQRYNTKAWETFLRYVKSLPDYFHSLDTKVAFSNTDVKKDDYISFRLPYALESGPTRAFDEMFQTLYDDENLTKIKWAIGSVLSGASKDIQKFYAFYGKPGTGKSTVLHVLGKLVEGHHSSVSVGALARFNNDFAMESLKNNPLVAIDHEGDLSRLESNSLLNSIVAHELIEINVKYTAKYSLRMNTAIFIATNKPIRITDTKSGLVRRLIDIQPTGLLVKPRRYDELMSQIEFELGGIAVACLKTFEQLGPDYYNEYRSREMIAKTNHLFDFVQEYAFTFERAGYIKRSEAWRLYQAYCESAGIQYPLPRYIFKDQFADYWAELKPNMRIDGKQNREVFVGFKLDVFKQQYVELAAEGHDWLSMEEQSSIFDRVLSDRPAQYVTRVGGLARKWDNNMMVLGELDTTRLHMVRPPSNLIMIDFDIKDSLGNKSLIKNIEAARTWPPTYAETSKSGRGLHLYYYYDGDPERLQRIYGLDIEVKPPIGKFAIRRQLTVCNGHEITTINSGLPLKPEGEPMLSRKQVASEAAMRHLVYKNIGKEYHANTKPSIDFIYAILSEGLDQGLEYDLRDMRPAVERLAASSTNQSELCLSIVAKMPFHSPGDESKMPQEPDTDVVVFFDVEVFPNLFILCYKFEGAENVFKFFNPSRAEVAKLLEYKLIGFNNRGYDNHILYAWISGESNADLYYRSSGLVTNRPDATIAKAYGISYADVYNYSSVKQNLKKWEVDLGIKYDEFDHPWDEPLPEKLWDRAAEYCANDVRATETLHESRRADFTARKILAELSGLRINDSTQSHVRQIIFGNNKTPQNEFNIPKLSEEFPGYRFDPFEKVKKKKSQYRGEDVGEGGYVWSEPGIYGNVVYLDVASMHPASLIKMNMFGPYTQNFTDLRDARILIKEGNLEAAGEMFGGRLKKFLGDKSEAADLGYALKIALNSVYGYTSTQKYDWAWTHPDNIDNVVAKRGALFMIDLKHALIERGCKPIHFKTDSVKIADFTPEDVLFVEEFGKRYGYDFGIEGIFERMVLINDAVLIGRWKKSGEWHAVGARFAHPYVYKTLFSHEKIGFDDMVETRMVSRGASIFLEKEDGARDFMGRIGQFCPVVEGGGKLIRVDGEKVGGLAGTVNYNWLPASVVSGLGLEDSIDRGYFDNLVKSAVDKIAKFGDADTFLQGEQND